METNICTGKRQGEKYYICLNLRIRGGKSLENLEFLYAFFYIFHHISVPCLLLCYALISEVNFTRSLTFICSTYFISHHFTPLMFFLCLSSHISVHIAIFPAYPKCDSTVHFSTLSGSVIRHHLHPRPSKEKLFFIISGNHVSSRLKARFRLRLV